MEKKTIMAPLRHLRNDADNNWSLSSGKNKQESCYCTNKSNEFVIRSNLHSSEHPMKPNKDDRGGNCFHAADKWLKHLEFGLKSEHLFSSAMRRTNVQMYSCYIKAFYVSLSKHIQGWKPTADVERMNAAWQACFLCKICFKWQVLMSISVWPVILFSALCNKYLILLHNWIECRHQSWSTLFFTYRGRQNTVEWSIPASVSQQLDFLSFYDTRSRCARFWNMHGRFHMSFPHTMLLYHHFLWWK